MSIRVSVAIALLLCSSALPAHDWEDSLAGWRSELWLGISAWPSLEDLRPVATGGFDGAGLALGGAIHWPVAERAGSDVLLGADVFFGATGSDVRGFVGDLYARHLYVGGSIKWALGEQRNVYLDAGVGFHLVDIAQLSDEWYGPEDEAWESSTGGALLGVTWDVGGRRDERRAGLTLSFKAYLFDLGTVRNEDPFGEDLLGTNAGRLDGPLYMLQIGYGGR